MPPECIARRVEIAREPDAARRRPAGNRESMKIRFVEYGGPEWKAARILRHSVFYRESGLPESVMDDGQEVRGSHLVALDSGAVVGYGRLNDLGDGLFNISHMAVAPEYRGKGVGRMLLEGLVKAARSAKAEWIRLSARLPAVSFYERAGFHRAGETFGSAQAGLQYVEMKLKLIDDADK